MGITTWVTNMLSGIVSETACILPAIFSLQNLWNCTVADQEARRSVLQHITATVYSSASNPFSDLPRNFSQALSVELLVAQTKNSGVTDGFWENQKTCHQKILLVTCTHMHILAETLWEISTWLDSPHGSLSLPILLSSSSYVGSVTISLLLPLFVVQWTRSSISIQRVYSQKSHLWDPLDSAVHMGLLQPSFLLL